MLIIPCVALFFIDSISKGGFKRETENLRNNGEWKQFQLYVKGRKMEKNCEKTPKTCHIIDQISEAKSNKRGQVSQNTSKLTITVIRIK